jgi:hypothetical protein
MNSKKLDKVVAELIKIIGNIWIVLAVVVLVLWALKVI